MYHKIGCHVYADDFQLDISFKCEQSLEDISKVNSCLSEINRWMITISYRLMIRKPNRSCLDLTIEVYFEWFVRECC